ncbi:MAG: 30S ribosomal protein S2 [Candidatus Heimdallarchaeaceae archaeon]|uniref:Small ribosomal subunit protein uS2 n=1 Tax=Candidatus Heimdallarchaeum endolithica TaxID=2876572 RepID=A0A9Y1FM41_9ARCH|nr:MAG: 30S ribosomal protein S2 [Candidatus Heimdallarchaeum endolithica]
MSEETKDPIEEEQALLVPRDEYLVSGIHIGTSVCTKSMQKYMYRVRTDGIFVLNVNLTDERIRTAAKFLARFEPSQVAVFATRQYASVPSTKMARYCGFKVFPGRFIPGTLTNPTYSGYIEPDVIILTDPRADKQALTEASSRGIPIIALCDTDNITTNVDFVIPVNNKGRKSLALVYYLLTRQVLIERGELGENEDLPETIEDFSFKLIRD